MVGALMRFDNGISVIPIPQSRERNLALILSSIGGHSSERDSSLRSE
jgi:hypothetical protein